MNDHQINIIARGLDEASGPLGNVGSSLSGLGGIATSVATGGLALVAVGLAALVGGAVLAGKAVWDFSRDTDEAMKLFSAQTGIAGDELADMKEIAKDVWAEGFGDSIGDVVDDMSLVHRAFGLTGDDLEDATRRAMTLADVFEMDVAESTMVASSMMNSWNISEQEAFDTLAKGSQMGLDRMGDLADTLHEYSGDFDNLGLTADQTLSILNAGLEAGAYNTDVVADGFREMGIRLMEGGEDMSEVFAGMGLDFEAMQASVAAGDETWGDYTSDIVEGLLAIDDEVARNAAGVEIFGTKWEDLGGDVFLAAGLATEGVEGIAGATDEMAETMATGIGPAFERLKRSAIENLSPLGDKAAEVLEKMTPFLEKATEWLGEKIPLAIDFLMPYFEKAEVWLGEKLPVAIEWLTETATDLSEYWTDTLQPALATVVDFVKEHSTPILAGLATVLAVVVIPAFVAWAASAIAAGAATIIALAPVVLPIIAIGAAVGLLVYLWNKHWETIRDSFASVWGNIKILFEHFKDWVGDKLAGAFETLQGKVDSVKRVFERFKEGLDRVKGVIQFVKDRIWELKDAFSNLRLPDWLTPGSPTPFENALRGISDALSVMPDLTVALKVPQVSMATAMPTAMPQMAGGGGGATYTIYNQFGKDSIRDDEDILLVGDAIREALEHRGVQPAL